MNGSFRQATKPSGRMASWSCPLSNSSDRSQGLRTSDCRKTADDSKSYLERETRLELATLCLGRRCPLEDCLRHPMKFRGGPYCQSVNISLNGASLPARAPEPRTPSQPAPRARFFIAVWRRLDTKTPQRMFACRQYAETGRSCMLLARLTSR